MAESRTGAVLVVDGDAAARGEAKAALERAGYHVKGFSSGGDALAAADADTPALALVELRLSDVTGYEVCRQIRDAYGDTVAVFLTSAERTESVDRVAALMLGADDFITKPFELEELVARVRRFVERAPHNKSRRGAALKVTPRERDVLTLLADGNNQQEIALALGISPKTVATHIQNLLGKFGAHSRAQLVALAYKQRLFD